MSIDPRHAELRNQIAHEVPFVGERPFSHNIITLALLEINRSFGREAANKAVRDLHLEAKGWSEEPEATNE